MSALHYEMRGRGKDLVLLHGWGLTLGVWDGLAHALARRFRVIAIDLPGHGRSDWDPKAVTPAAQAWRVTHWRLAARLNADTSLEEPQRYAAARAAVGLP